MFHIALRVAQGVNFPYYVMGKAQLRILPFSDPWTWVAPGADPYALFAQEYGAKASEVGEVAEPWYDWLAHTSAHCPDDARDSLRHCPGSLHGVAERVLPEYLARWPDLQAKLAARAAEAVAAGDLAAALRRNEQLFGLRYPDEGEEIVHLVHFPTVATQHPGPHFVFGLGCLSRPEVVLREVESEVGLKLLAQIVEDPRVASHREEIEALTADDRYVHGLWSLLEAVNNMIRAIARHGAALTRDDLPQKPGEWGYHQLLERLFRSRHLWPEAGVVGFVCGALEERWTAGPAAGSEPSCG